MKKEKVSKLTFLKESGLSASEIVKEYYDFKEEKEKEEIMEELEKQIQKIDKELRKYAEEFYERFKGWEIIENEYDSMDGWVYWEKWKLKDPSSGKIAIVFQGIDWEEDKYNIAGGYFTITCYFEIEKNQGE